MSICLPIPQPSAIMHHLGSEAKGAQALVVGLVCRAQVDQHQRLPVTRKGRLQEICQFRVPEWDLEEEEEEKVKQTDVRAKRGG